MLATAGIYRLKHEWNRMPNETVREEAAWRDGSIQTRHMLEHLSKMGMVRTSSMAGQTEYFHAVCVLWGIFCFVAGPKSVKIEKFFPGRWRFRNVTEEYTCWEGPRKNGGDNSPGSGINQRASAATAEGYLRVPGNIPGDTAKKKTAHGCIISCRNHLSCLCFASFTFYTPSGAYCDHFVCVSVCLSVCLSVCVFVCLLTICLKKYLTNQLHTWWRQLPFHPGMKWFDFEKTIAPG